MRPCCPKTAINFRALAKNKIDIQFQTNTVDEYGSPITTWTSLGTFWAIIEPKTVTEILERGQLIAKVTHKITIRFNSEVNPSCKIVFNSREFNILGIKKLDNDLKMEGNRFIEMMAVEGELG